MAVDEGDAPHRGKDVPDEPTYRVRRDDATAFRTAFLILGGLISLLGFFWTVVSRLDETSRVEVRNERIERINADARLDQRVYSLEQRRR